MTFAWPLVLWLLLCPAVMLGLELRRRRRQPDSAHPHILRAEAAATRVDLVEGGSDLPGAKPRLWLWLGVSLGIVALARPQWGRLDEPVFEQSREILIAMDLSRSMLTPDVKPSRLERSKLLVQSLLDRLQGERVGLVVFSGTAFLQSPMSADYEILREFLPALGPDFLPEGGTNYKDLLQTSIDAFGSSAAADRFLIILSDGEATDDDWKDQISVLQKKGIKVIGLGVGTKEGSMIPDGSGGFLKDETGAVVKSHLESETLRQLATATGGIYTDASRWVDLASLVHSTVDEGKKGRFTEHNSVRLAERFQWALAPALCLLLISFWRELPVMPKPRKVTLTRAGSSGVLAACVSLAFAMELRAADAPTSADTLGKMIARVSAADNRSALDWSEIAHQTVDWGNHIQSQHQPVPEGPVHDALAAVGLGRAIDPNATNWDKVQEQLNELLKKAEPTPPPKSPTPPPQQQNQNSNQDSKPQDPKKQPTPPPSKDSSQKQSPKDEASKPQEGGQQGDAGQRPGEPKPPQGKPPGSSAFGDLSPKDKPQHDSQPSTPTQKVGGTREKEPYDPAKADPSLAIPLEKLDQAKTQDQPSELYSLIRRGEPAPPPDKKGKNW